MSWGDLDHNGKPISRDAGRCYRQWVDNVQGYGYRFDHRILNAADYGAYTSRRRFFGIFAKGDLPIVFPEPTHCKEGASGLFGQLKRWKPVREVLDLSDEGESIFGRKKPLVENTLERIYAGLIKFVPECSSVDKPAGTITTCDHHSFITAYYGNGNNHSIDAPDPTLTTHDRFAFVDMQYGNGTPCDIDTPAPTVTTNPKHKLVTCKQHNLIQTEQGEVAIVINPNDCPAMVKIKEFMALYGIIDIKMRMLRIPELKRIMGFPSDYVLVGTQADQNKFIGNAVEVNIARALCEALCSQLIKNNIEA